ncbi:hypothetical protein PsYK624_024430 [Phanerochaete sordida]|uniref:Uncharacterized protein n=1 Tax=Phanerochaete sordida TaxID=48140 RepID=A0A9P3G177_9APHY|nr:hypothetical protein PsYK624_024430 [Phanerochaete sordida]
MQVVFSMSSDINGRHRPGHIGSSAQISSVTGASPWIVLRLLTEPLRSASTSKSRAAVGVLKRRSRQLVDTRATLSNIHLPTVASSTASAVEACLARNFATSDG